MHILPQLRKLERKYPKELVVVGVHSGKFLAERRTENIRQAVLRLEIEHPVVNDRQFRVWKAFEINAWPTLVLVNPVGHYVDTFPGEMTFESFDPLLQKLVDEYRAKGHLDPRPLPVPLERSAEPPRALAFPGKLLAASNGRLFVSDTNHHRIIDLQLEDGGRRGKVAAIVGRGEPGLDDGGFATASFNRPQGLALDGDVLYVADTENHAVRKIDWRRRIVETVAGTGEQARHRLTSGMARNEALNSPWDLVIVGNWLFIAMAGSHQVWKMNFATGQIAPHAGSGFEELTDRFLLGAGLAQPSGLASDGQRLFFADSESSAIRRADLAPDGEVRTIVGTGLFDFGDKDGVGNEVRLQHPLGVVWHEGLLYVADTYNNKIKIIDPGTRRSTTFLGTGEAGLVDGVDPQFSEPGGLGIADSLLFVADTNNHAIRVADLKTGQVKTVSLPDVVR